VRREPGENGQGRFGEHNNSFHYSTVVRCRFDGRKLMYVEHGDEMKGRFRTRFQRAVVG